MASFNFPYSAALMLGSRLSGGKFPMNRSSPLARNTAFKPFSPITSCAELNACRTSALTTIIEAFLSVIHPPDEEVVSQRYIQDIARPCGQTPSFGKGLVRPHYHFACSLSAC